MDSLMIDWILDVILLCPFCIVFQNRGGDLVLKIDTPVYCNFQKFLLM